MTITFREYLDAKLKLPHPCDASSDTYKVILRKELNTGLYDQSSTTDTVPILTFHRCGIRYSNGTELFYWKPDATIIP